MKVFLISYDLVKPGRDYTKLIEAIKSYSGWAHPLESVWVVTSSADAGAIRDHLKAFIDGNDKLVVARLQGDWATYNVDTKVSDWFHQHVTKATVY